MCPALICALFRRAPLLSFHGHPCQTRCLLPPLELTSLPGIMPDSPRHVRHAGGGTQVGVSGSPVVRECRSGGVGDACEGAPHCPAAGCSSGRLWRLGWRRRRRPDRSRHRECTQVRCCPRLVAQHAISTPPLVCSTLLHCVNWPEMCLHSAPAACTYAPVLLQPAAQRRATMESKARHSTCVQCCCLCYSFFRCCVSACQRDGRCCGLGISAPPARAGDMPQQASAAQQGASHQPGSGCLVHCRARLHHSCMLQTSKADIGAAASERQ
jgi:hypothetical protein